MVEKLKIEIDGRVLFIDLDRVKQMKIFYRQREMELTPVYLQHLLEEIKNAHDDGELY